MEKGKKLHHSFIYIWYKWPHTLVIFDNYTFLALITNRNRQIRDALFFSNICTFQGSIEIALIENAKKCENMEHEKQKEEKKLIMKKKSEKYWGQRQNGWAGAVMVGRGR